MDPDPLIRIIRSGKFLNKTLISICNSEGLSKGGVKAELQGRIIDSTLRQLLELAVIICCHVTLYQWWNATGFMTLRRWICYILDRQANSSPELHEYMVRNDPVGFNRLKNVIENPNALNNAPSPNNATSAANAHLHATFHNHNASNMPGALNSFRGFGNGLSKWLKV